jgi:MFS family permease
MKEYNLPNLASTKFILFLSTFLIMCGGGLFNTIFSLEIKNNSGSAMIVGVLSSLYFTGMLIGSLKISILIKIVGYVNSFLTIAAVMTIFILMPVMTLDVSIWGFCRFVQGFCIASLFVIIESWVLSSYSHKVRGKGLSHYMSALYGSYAIGQLFFFYILI